MPTCQSCGQEYDLAQKNKIITNVMNEYVDPKTGKVDGIYNSNEDIILVKGVTLHRKGYKPTDESKPEGKSIKTLGRSEEPEHSLQTQPVKAPTPVTKAPTPVVPNLSKLINQHKSDAAPSPIAANADPVKPAAQT